MRDAVLERLLADARRARCNCTALYVASRSPIPGAHLEGGDGLRHDAPRALIAELDLKANAAAGLVHARVDALLRGRAAPEPSET